MARKKISTLEIYAGERVKIERRLEILKAKRKICLDQKELSEIIRDIELSENQIKDLYRTAEELAEAIIDKQIVALPQDKVTLAADIAGAEQQLAEALVNAERFATALGFTGAGLQINSIFNGVPGHGNENQKMIDLVKEVKAGLSPAESFNKRKADLRGTESLKTDVQHRRYCIERLVKKALGHARQVAAA